MKEKFIDITNGHFFVSNDLEVSAKTAPENLILHFGQENLKIADLQNGWKHYFISNAHKGKFYFHVTFYFEKDRLSMLSFIVDDKLILPGSWDNWSEENELRRKDYFDQWLSEQIGKKRTFHWGTINAFYDNKGGSSSIVLEYNKSRIGTA